MDNNFETTNTVVPNEPKKKSNKGLIIFLVLIILGLTGFITYDKVYKKEETKKCPKCEVCKKCEVCTKCKESNNKQVYGTNSGTYLAVSYTDSEFTIYDSSTYDDNNNVIFKTNTQKVTGDKIKTAKIMVGAISSGMDEAAVIIMESGKVYLAYNGDNFIYEQVKGLEKYKVSDISKASMSCGDGCTTTYDLVLQDGTTQKATIIE